MEVLSGEPLYAAVGSLSTKEIFKLCASNKQLNSNLCDNEDFWQYRYIQERGPPKVIPASWKRAYLFPQDIYVFGKDITHPLLVKFHRAISNVQIHNGQVRTIFVLTTDGEVYMMKLETSDTFVQLKFEEKIKQIVVRSDSPGALMLTDTGKVYYVSINRMSLGILPIPFGVKLLSDKGEGFLSVDNAYYVYPGAIEYSELVQFFDHNPQPQTMQLPENITQMDGPVQNPVFLADGKKYNSSIMSNVVRQFVDHPFPIRKLLSLFSLLEMENGEIWKDDKVFDPRMPLAKDADFARGVGLIVVDNAGGIWINQGVPTLLLDQWREVDLPIKATHTSDGAVWGPAPLVTSFAHFSQLVNRGKIPEFKVPAQPGMNEPYVDTFLIPDVEGYQYEVTARYDPQTGEMTAP